MAAQSIALAFPPGNEVLYRLFWEGTAPFRMVLPDAFCFAAGKAHRPKRPSAVTRRLLVSMDIYVGNLAYATDDESLRAAFAAFGEVSSARVVTDRMTGRSKGFGFVEMPNADEANAAIAALNGTELDGRQIRANESQPKPREERRGFGGGRGGFGGPRRGGFGGGRGGYGNRGGRGGYGGPRRDGDAPRESQW